MSGQKRGPDRLVALERWQSSELEDARLQMTRLDAIAADKQADVERIEGDIVELHSLAREYATGSSPLDAETLLRMNEFNAHRQQELQSARHGHEQAARQADDAQRDVLRRFENLSVVQRLLERRQQQIDQEEQRLVQKQLDEGALTRTPQVHNAIGGSEERGHGS